MAAFRTVTLWHTDGRRDTLDRVLDSALRSALGPGRWSRRCEQCGSDRHGGRVFGPVSVGPVSVGVAHAGRHHVAVTAWTREPIAVDVEALRTAGQLANAGPLFAGDDEGVLPQARLQAWVAHEAAVKLRGGLGAVEQPGQPVHTIAVHVGAGYHCVVAAPFPIAYSAR